MTDWWSLRSTRLTLSPRCCLCSSEDRCRPDCSSEDRCRLDRPAEDLSRLARVAGGDLVGDHPAVGCVLFGGVGRLTGGSLGVAGDLWCSGGSLVFRVISLGEDHLVS